MRTSASAVDLTPPIEQDAAHEVLNPIMAADGKNVELSSLGSAPRATVELEDRYV
jgi:hypothetical protein